MNPAFMKNIFPNSRGVAYGSGWMDTDTFLLYLDHFIEHAKPSENNPVLIILDGHSSHKSINAILKCRENFITLLTLPPHTSHQTQPLDRTVFGPVKGAYQTECDDFTGGKINVKISVYDVGELFSNAFRKRATANSGIRGFEVTGIWPCNRNIFDENLFHKPYTTEMPEVEDMEEDVDDPKELSPINSNQNFTQTDVAVTSIVSQDSSVCAVNNLPDSPDKNEFLNTIKKVSSRSNADFQQTSTILTSSPNKNKLIEKWKEAQKKIEMKKEKGKKELPKDKKKKKPQKRKISSIVENSVNDDTECLYCCDKFSRSKAKEMCKCKRWAHEDCAEPGNTHFICDLCVA